MTQQQQSSKPLLMGIVNVTPDSFSDGGKYFNFKDAINHAKKLIDFGIDIIDIGGESTKPHAKPVSEEEELERVIPVIKGLRDLRSDVLISVDTYKSKVAREAILNGANIINDVSGLTMDKNMVHVARELNSKIIIMHNDGIPATKPKNNQGIMSIDKIYKWLENQTKFAIGNGIKKENIIIDPGIGFGKTPEEDLFIIQNLNKLKSLKFPILVGFSKKSFIKNLFGENNLEEKSKELTELAIKNGADILRVHVD